MPKVGGRRVIIYIYSRKKQRLIENMINNKMPKYQNVFLL